MPANYENPTPRVEAPQAHIVVAGPEKPQWLQGKLTFIGLILASIGYGAKAFGYSVPTDEIQDFLGFMSNNWSVISEGLGILIAGYGRIRINFRKA